MFSRQIPRFPIHAEVSSLQTPSLTELSLSCQSQDETI